jgi:hypothetical protein
MQRIRFRCWMVWPAANQFLLPSYVVGSESVFAADIVWSAANQRSLLKLCGLQRTRVHCWNCVAWRELVFAVEIVLFTANTGSLPKLYCVQRTRVRYRNCIVCSEAAFAAEIVLSVANQCSLLNYSTNNRTVSTAKLWCPNELVHWWFCVPANPFANEFALQRTSSLTSSCFSKLVR